MTAELRARMFRAVSYLLMVGLLLVVVTLAVVSCGPVAAVTSTTTVSAASVSTTAATLPVVATTEATTATTTASTSTSESTTTTSEVTTTTTQPDPKGWTRFRAEGVSVALPSGFLGGAPDSPQVKALVGPVVTQSWLDGWENHFTGQEDLLLLMVSPNLGNPMPFVMVTRYQLDQDQTFESHVLDVLTLHLDPGAKLDTSQPGPGRELLTITVPIAGTHETATRQMLLVDAGEYVYHFYYIAETAAAWRSVRAAFQTSMGGIITGGS